MTDELNLSTLKPAQERRARKRVGRGQGSGKGRYSGRGIKGQKSRSGSKKMRPGFEGGQMPIYMRVGKQRGATSKDAMPIGPFRTFTEAVNVSSLDRFDAGAEVTPESLKAIGLIKSTKRDVKILGHGDLSKSLVVSAHAFSKSAREKIEAAGGSVTWLRGEPKPKRKRTRKAKPATPGTQVEPTDEPEAAAEEVPTEEAATEEAPAEDGEA
jgi:large subunit ribosomal protein L15